VPAPGRRRGARGRRETAGRSEPRHDAAAATAGGEGPKPHSASSRCTRPRGATRGAPPATERARGAARKGAHGRRARVGGAARRPPKRLWAPKRRERRGGVSQSVSASPLAARRSHGPPNSDQARPCSTILSWVYLCALHMDFLCLGLCRGPPAPVSHSRCVRLRASV